MATCDVILRNYRPYDADRGIEEPARDVPCRSEAGHYGYHQGTDGLPFGPWRETPSPVAGPSGDTDSGEQA